MNIMNIFATLKIVKQELKYLDRPVKGNDKQMKNEDISGSCVITPRAWCKLVLR